MKFVNIVLILLFIGCAKPSLKVDNQKLIKAIICENYADFNCSINEYKKLYQESKKKVFFRKYVKNLFFAKKYKKLLEVTKNSKDEEILKYRIFTLIELKKLKEAKSELIKKLNKKDEFFYQMMSYLYFKEKKYKKAAIFLKSLYALNPSKKNLLFLVDNLIKLKKYNEAVAYLQTFIKENGCDFEVCQKAAFIYKEMYDYENLIKIYEKLGKINSIFYLKALGIYLEKEDYDDALKFIKKHDLSEVYSLLIYEKLRDNKNIAKISKKLYKKTKNDEFLLKYIYASLEIDKSKKNVLKLLPKIKKLLKYKTPSIYNLYGYLLIDYDINVKKGIYYVKKALKFEPKNWAYLDSLAWGYYKLKLCKKAYKIISKIKVKDREIEYHKKKIKECYDFRKNNKKNKTKSKT